MIAPNPRLQPSRRPQSERPRQRRPRPRFNGRPLGARGDVQTTVLRVSRPCSARPLLQHYVTVVARLRRNRLHWGEFIAPAFGLLVFGYGGVPFLRMGAVEAHNREPGMMLLISLAITVAFVYSIGAVAFGVGEPFFWELVTLIVIFLLGHWVEMRSVRRASGALDHLADLMPHPPNGSQTVVSRRRFRSPNFSRMTSYLFAPGERASRRRRRGRGVERQRVDAHRRVQTRLRRSPVTRSSAGRQTETEAFASG